MCAAITGVMVATRGLQGASDELDAQGVREFRYIAMHNTEAESPRAGRKRLIQ